MKQRKYPVLFKECIICHKQMKASTNKKIYCSHKCNDKVFKNKPEQLEKSRKYARLYHEKHKDDINYKKMKYKRWLKWAKKNKEKVKLYYREYQRKKLHINPENFKIKDVTLASSKV